MAGSATNTAHVDQNQNPSLLGVIGTLGTADQQGTALTLPVGVHEQTGAMYVYNIAPTSGGGTSDVNILSGTLNSLPQISVGTIPQLSIGTIPQVSVGTLPNLPSGTITTLTSGTINALASGTITSIPQISVGTIPQVSVGTLPNVTLANPGTFVNIATGTQQTLGTVGVINNVVTGTISALASGTVSRGSVGGLVNSGAAAAVGGPVWIGGTDSNTNGTFYGIQVDSTGFLQVNAYGNGGFKLQQEAGPNFALLVGMRTGTISTGTIQNLVSGTINAGTVDTELPAAALVADTTSNMTAPTVVNANLVYNSATWDKMRSVQADSAGATGLLTAVPALFNEFNYDRQRNNTELTFLGTGSRTTGTQTSSDQTNYNGRGIRAVVVATSRTGAGTLIVSIDGKDSNTGAYYSLIQTAALAAVGTNILTVYPGITNTVNVGTSQVASRIYRLTAAITGAGTFTYAVSHNVMV